MRRALGSGQTESLENTLVILLRVDKPLYHNTHMVWTVGNEVAFKTAHPPEKDSSVFPLANFAS